MIEGENQDQPIPDAESRFSVVNNLGEDRGAFHDLFSQWAVSDERLAEHLENAPDTVRQAFSHVTTGDEGEPRPRQEILAEYTGFVSSQTQEALDAINQVRSKLREENSKK